ncbi:MAG: sugar phosphate nucleotidyltransferase [Bacteroidota bacterium]
MKIIIPMAGRGSRLRPHTLTVPKPLYPIAGKPIVQRLVEDIVQLYDGKVEEIAFVIGDFGETVETQLQEIAAELGAKGHIFHQDEPLGTAHAIWMAESVMEGEVIIAFADTLFVANFSLDRNRDGAIWVKSVEDPRSFGVVTLNEEGVIAELVEKPQDYVSDLAIIGIYYIREGEKLRAEIKHLLDHDLREKGEYQLTNALENMKEKGAQFVPGKVDEWMDCGNKHAVLDTSQRILEISTAQNEATVHESVALDSSKIVPPCFIGRNVKLTNSVVGPFVSLGDNTVVTDSVISATIVGDNSQVTGAVLKGSLVGNHALVEYRPKNLDIGDYSRIRE